MTRRVCATLQKPFSSLAAEFMNASEVEKQKGCNKVTFAYRVLTLMKDVEKSQWKTWTFTVRNYLNT